jgi:hypothetical protein
VALALHCPSVHAEDKPACNWLGTPSAWRASLPGSVSICSSRVPTGETAPCKTEQQHCQ